MPNNKPKILVLGATGQVGKGVVENLKHNSNVEVIAAARSPEKAKSLGVPVVYLDFDKPNSITAALQDVHRAFLATGYTIDMMRQSKDFLNLAKKAGVRSSDFFDEAESQKDQQGHPLIAPRGRNARL
jgi:uncharacterized protein YbjT (DUF2867 family)